MTKHQTDTAYKITSQCSSNMNNTA